MNLRVSLQIILPNRGGFTTLRYEALKGIYRSVDYYKGSLTSSASDMIGLIVSLHANCTDACKLFCYVDAQ
jgi:hypothetical protein